MGFLVGLVIADMFFGEREIISNSAGSRDQGGNSEIDTLW